MAQARLPQHEGLHEDRDGRAAECGDRPRLCRGAGECPGYPRAWASIKSSRTSEAFFFPGFRMGWAWQERGHGTPE